MPRPSRCLLCSALVLLALALVRDAAAADWPEFRGAARDGRSTETGLLQTWPADGPKVLWRVPIGSAFSAMVVAEGALYTLDSAGEDEFAVALDAETGKERWRRRIGAIFRESWGDGPRSAPLVDADTVYALSARGTLHALGAKDGAARWQIDFPTRFGSELPTWGFAMSPIVVGELLIVEVAGKEVSIAAFDKKTGEERWTSHKDATAYNSPLRVTVGGVDHLVFMTGTQVLGVDFAGKILWQLPFAPEVSLKPAIPVFVPPDLLFFSASYDVGALSVRLSSSGPGTLKAEEVWRNRAMRNHFNASVAVGSTLYGFDNSALKCLDAQTGEACWVQRGGNFGKGSLIWADGQLVVLSELGKLLLVEATSEGYRERGAMQLFPEGRSWTSPTLANGRLYLRNREELVCLDWKG